MGKGENWLERVFFVLLDVSLALLLSYLSFFSPIFLHLISPLSGQPRRDIYTLDIALI